MIATERTLRALVLVVVGAVLVSHTHTAWGRVVQDVAYRLNFNPHSTGIERIAARLSAVSPKRVELFGVIALAYGALEGVEAYGLWRRRRWGEYLTVLATAILLVPEGWELAHKPTVLKVVGTLVNVAIVVYLIVRLKRGTREPAPQPQP